MTFATEIGSPDGEKLRVHRLGYKVEWKEDFALTRKEKSNQYQLSPTQRGRGLSLYPYTRSLYGIYLRLLSSTGSRTKPSHTTRTVPFSRTYSMNWKSSSPGSITWDRYGNTPSDAMCGRGASRLMSGDAANGRSTRFSPPANETIISSRGPHKHHWTLDRMLAHWLKEMDLIHDFSVDRVTERGSIYEVRVQKDAWFSKRIADRRRLWRVPSPARSRPVLLRRRGLDSSSLNSQKSICTRPSRVLWLTSLSM